MSSTTSARPGGVRPKAPDESLRNEETVKFWEHDLPLQMAELAAELEPGHRFDAIVVDEAQDFADAWWDPLLAALKDEETSGIYLFTDEGQRVFSRYGSPPVPLVPLILDHNLRNTRQIANAFQPLVDHPMRFLGGEGPAVKYVACSREEAMGGSATTRSSCFSSRGGGAPEDVALLTTGTRHPEQKERQAAGSAAYWDSFWDAEQVFYGHVLGFKGGLERRAVVLVVNEDAAFERSRERLYVGLSRARDQLVVCGDPRVHPHRRWTGSCTAPEHPGLTLPRVGAAVAAGGILAKKRTPWMPSQRDGLIASSRLKMRDLSPSPSRSMSRTMAPMSTSSVACWSTCGSDSITSTNSPMNSR